MKLAIILGLFSSREREEEETERDGEIFITFRNVTNLSFPQEYVTGPITVVSNGDSDNSGIYFNATTIYGERPIEWFIRQLNTTQCTRHKGNELPHRSHCNSY